MTLDEFKANGKQIKNLVCSRNDIIDLDNGTMTIYSENLNKYLERYACKDAEDLINTLWFNYGVLVRVID